MKTDQTVHSHESWNKGKLVGQKAPLKLKNIWAIRVRLQLSNRVRDLALFDLAIDSKLRACDLTKLKPRLSISHQNGICRNVPCTRIARMACSYRVSGVTYAEKGPSYFPTAVPRSGFGMDH